MEWCAQPTGGDWVKLVDISAPPYDRTESVTESVTESSIGDPGRFYRVVTPYQP